MGKFSAIVGLAALAGVGYYVGKKVFEKKKADEENYIEPEVFVEERHSTPKEKLQKASLFAVGAIKTGTEKFKEGIDEIINTDMVTKGEDTVNTAKETVIETKDKAVNFAKDKGEALKGEIENLKNMVTSINTGAGEAEDEVIDPAEADISDESEAAETEEITEAAESDEAAEESELPDAADTAEPETTSALKFEAATGLEEIEAPIEEAVDEITEAADEIDSLSFDSADSISVDTFDFSAADKL